MNGLHGVVRGCTQLTQSAFCDRISQQLQIIYKPCSSPLAYVADRDVERQAQRTDPWTFRPRARDQRVSLQEHVQSLNFSASTC
jgi:hypothetical protein